ncbi:MAG: ribosomal protein S19 family protein [Nanoarchaeota archaeon]
MAKELTFRGKTLNELQQIDTREFAKYLKARQKRSVLRQFDKIEQFILRCKKKEGKIQRTQSREFVVVPKMIGFNIGVYNGKEYVPVKITGEMLGHRLGEFVQTRKRVQHGVPGIGATKSSASMSVK